LVPECGVFVLVLFPAGALLFNPGNFSALAARPGCEDSRLSFDLARFLRGMEEAIPYFSTFWNL